MNESGSDLDEYCLPRDRVIARAASQVLDD